jgi:hypothetical protein
MLVPESTPAEPTKMGVREPGGRELFARYWRGAIDVPGPVCDELGKVAGAYGIMPWVDLPAGENLQGPPG